MILKVSVVRRNGWKKVTFAFAGSLNWVMFLVGENWMA